MDKELLRVVIILCGVLVMIVMLLWHFFKSLRERREYDDNDAVYARGAPHFEDDDVDADEEELFNFTDGAVVDGDALLDDESIKPSAKQAVPKAAPSEIRKAIGLSNRARRASAAMVPRFSLFASRSSLFPFRSSPEIVNPQWIVIPTVGGPLLVAGAEGPAVCSHEEPWAQFQAEGLSSHLEDSAQARHTSSITGIISGRRDVFFTMNRFRSWRIFSLIMP